MTAGEEDLSPVEWGPERLGELTTLCAAALGDEHVSMDDLEGVAFAPDLGDLDGPLGLSVVLGTPTGTGAVAVSLRRVEGSSITGFVQLLVVHPSRRRRGIARSLLDAAERWAAERGATVLQAGGAAPVYLFTGVDSRWTDAVCCFEALGYSRVAVELDLVCPTRSVPPSAPPHGVTIGSVATDEDLAKLVEWSRRRWPAWEAELARAGAAGTAVVARDEDGGIVGAAAHSVGRLGVIGPVAVDPARAQRGIGSALMSAVLSQLSVAGLQRAEIAWVSTVRFYVRCCGARMHRASQVMRRELAPRAVGAGAPPAAGIASPS